MEDRKFRQCSVIDSGTVAVKIMVAIDRDINKNDSVMMMELCEKIHGELKAESIRLHPNSAKEAEILKNGYKALFGGGDIFMQPIPNEYCSSYCCRHKPWYLVTTKVGVIKVGWRKRVVVIDYAKTCLTVAAETLFKDEDVTKYDKVVHAWSLDKAKEYIDIIIKAACAV